jgi:tetratricopeptide (TPR) repeat protein
MYLRERAVKYLPALIFLMGLVAGASYSAKASTLSENEKYRECTALVHSTSARAVDYATDWLKVSPDSLSAQHCRALGLYGSGDYQQAASVLGSVALQLEPSGGNLWNKVMEQLGWSYFRARKFEDSVTTFTNLLARSGTEMPEEELVSVLMKRARAFQESNEPLKAFQDADHVLSLNPSLIDALLLRSDILAAMGQRKAAEEDLEKILKIDATHEAAKARLSQLSSD